MATKPNPIVAKKKEPIETIDQRIAKFRQRRELIGIDWSQVSATSLRAVLTACLTSGAAIMFSAAAGGVGVCVTVFSDGQKPKEYFMDAPDLVEYLDAVTQVFQSESEDLLVSMANGVK